MRFENHVALVTGAASGIGRAATSTYGRLDILCNNAGIMDLMTPAADVPLALWDRVLAVNLTGPFLACRRAIPLMLQQGGGSIVNTASEAGLRGGAAGTPFTVSKHGVVGLTRVSPFTMGTRAFGVMPSVRARSKRRSGLEVDRRTRQGS